MHRMMPFFILSVLILSGCNQGQKITLTQDYNFLINDGEVKKIRQSNDTLYELKCYIDQPCVAAPESHYKILSIQKNEEFTFLKLEELDTGALNTGHYLPTRYSILALKNINNNQLGYLPLRLGSTKDQLDTTKVNIQLLKEKFFFTYFSDNYLKELSSLKPVITKEDVKKISEVIESDKYKRIIEMYSNTETRDLYQSGLLAEFLCKACIEKGFNPIGAGRSINKLMK